MVSSDPEPVSLQGRRALVLGGSVFVGRHLVDALVQRGADVAVLNRGRTHSELPDGVERLVADRTDAAQMSAALAGRSWDAVFDVSGFVMAAGGSDIEGLLDLIDGHVGAYVYTSSIMAYDQSWAGVFPWTEDQPTNPDGADQLRRLQGAGRGLDPGAARGDRVSGIGRQAQRPSTGRTTTSTTWNCRCSCDCSSTGRSSCRTGGSSSERTGTSTICARR